MGRRALTQEQITAARVLRQGMPGLYTWGRLGTLFSVSADTIRLALDPEWAEMRRKQVKKARHKRSGSPTWQYEYRGEPCVPYLRHPTDRDRVPLHEIRLRQSEIPDDTRDLTGRMFGDPLPGRSALDQRGVRG